MCVCVCVYVYVFACVYVCVCKCVYVCAYVSLPLAHACLQVAGHAQPCASLLLSYDSFYGIAETLGSDALNSME